MIPGRRAFVRELGALGALAVVGCGASHEAEEPGGAITPAEDLMREHGVIERVLVVWHEADGPLRRGEAIDLDALRSSITLVQRFIEGYHEREEEELVFPRLEQAGREVALVATLREQHRIGRGITAEVAGLLGGAPDAGSRVRVASRLGDYARMYLAHASREDTVVFPAHREIVGDGYAALGGQMEHREHELVGEDAFEHAVEEIARIERALGLDDLARLSPASG